MKDIGAAKHDLAIEQNSILAVEVFDLQHAVMPEETGVMTAQTRVFELNITIGVTSEHGITAFEDMFSVGPFNIAA